jgi:beta-xylosidase
MRNVPNEVATIKIILMIAAVLCGATLRVSADVGNKGPWGDQGDGTFKNPILPGDYSDPDVIRVGSDYYLITSTFQYSPGMAVLQSRDLVNWKFIGHCVNDMTRIGPEFNWDRMNRYNHGIYAGAIRYHKGKFWVYFTTLDEGVFITTAKDAAGPWEPVRRIWDQTWLDDPCPFWDDDGQAYLLYSTPGRQWYTHLIKMSADGTTLDLASDKVIDNFNTSEGNKLYKFKGLYYVFHNEVRGDDNRVGVMLRAKNIWGPYEKKEILHGGGRDHERQPNQGGLVQTEAGDWWFITQQGRGSYEGRSCCLLPVKWVDGWPIPGRIDETGAGNIIWTARKPIGGLPIITPQTDDEFDKPVLSPQWEWNHQPRKEKWSLTERPGFLRLDAFRPLERGNLLTAGNTLTQRLACTEGGVVTVKFDVSKMADGQEAGICHYGKRYGWLGISQAGGVRKITYSANGTQTAGPTVKSADVWLRSIISDTGAALWKYSLDGKAFVAFGEKYKFEWANYRGDRIGIFNYNNNADAGLVDVDWFHYSFGGPKR